MNKFKKKAEAAVAAVEPHKSVEKVSAMAQIAGRKIPALALVMLSDRTWTRVRLLIEGDRVTAIEATEPNVKAIAAEKFKIDVAAMLTGDGEPLK